LRAHVGSVIDGEDVLQDALIKAVESLASAARRNPKAAVPDRATTPRWISCAAATPASASIARRRWN